MMTMSTMATRSTTSTKRIAALALCAALALPAACSERQTHLKLTFPGGPDGGTCATQTDIKCVNYLEFSAGDNVSGFTSQCVKVDVAIGDLCDVAKLAEGQELFKLAPGTSLPIRVEGKRVFPATSCNSGDCPARTIFSGQTDATGTIGDHAGETLEIPLTVVHPCGVPEQFFFLPPGRTCAELCGGTDLLVCDGVQGGCLCLDQSAMTSRQGGIDGGQ
jgi:hypothetical protein